MTRHTQATQNNKFAKSLHYSKILHLAANLGQEWSIMVQHEVFSTLIKTESLILAGITFK